MYISVKGIISLTNAIYKDTSIRKNKYLTQKLHIYSKDVTEHGALSVKAQC